jgi:AraC-like DNA-binding protein
VVPLGSELEATLGLDLFKERSMSTALAYDQIASTTAGNAATVAIQQGARTRAANTRVGQDGPAERGRVAAIVIKLLEDAGDVIYRDCDAARVCIARASALLRDDVGHEHASVTLVRGGLAPWQISRVKAHVEAHLDSTLRMRDLAAIVRLSTGHFSRSFTRSFGVAPFAYVAGRRFARAQELMLTTDDPLSQIALACGLCDQSHLTRLFRRHVGTSPNAWRRSHRRDPDALPVRSTPTPRTQFPPLGTESVASLHMYSGARP